ncbi:MAG: family 10 glycosylhydrolase, partial [Crocinitomicaceae bacterium]
MKISTFFSVFLLGLSFSVSGQEFFEPIIPKHYVANKVSEKITFDGVADESCWQTIEWTDLFQDIEGDKKPSPFYDTRVKILWDDTFIYFYTEMEEEHVWADIQNRDEVIFYNNDFEIFMKPYTNATHYAELEVNALGTVWDLLLMNAYREGGPIINDWDMEDLKVGVHVDGKINNPKKEDKGWSLEIGVPWSSLDELLYGKKHKSIPDPWRINFSRVQWEHDLKNGKYQRKKGKKEYNWVWCQQSAIDMHRPEHWGYVLFTDGSISEEKLLEWQSHEEARQYLFYLYRLQKQYRKKKFQEIGKWEYAPSLEMLNPLSSPELNPVMTTTEFGFEISVEHDGKRITVNQQGQLSEKDIEEFVYAAWMHGNKNRSDEEWLQIFQKASRSGISDLFIGGGADELRRYVQLADSFDLKIHGWVWTMNRPGDSVARQHPEWYAVNRAGKNSLEYNAYVGYYQWLSPFSPGAREHIKNNIRQIAEVEGLASVHLDYVRFCDVILGKALQPKYDLVQTTEMPEYDYGYHPIAREAYKTQTGVDPIEIEHPELSTEWRQFRLNAVTSLVNELSDIAHSFDKKISAAVFPFPEMSRSMVRQDWSSWHLDMVLPMIYHNFYKENLNWIEFSTKQGVNEVDGRFPLYTGL